MQLGESLQESPTPELRAERLVAEYLRVWGMRDPRTISTLSRHWVQNADFATSMDQNTSINDVYRAVMQRVIADIEQWLDRLASEVFPGSRDAHSRRGLLAVELQTIIDQCPAVLLHDGPLPAEMLEQLATAAVPVVPAGSPTHMPTQSLAAVSSSKYLSRWRDGWKQLWRRPRIVSQQAGSQG